MRHGWGTGDVQTGFGWGDLRERDHSEDFGADWMNNLK
jgi:hypothetical protein